MSKRNGKRGGGRPVKVKEYRHPEEDEFNFNDNFQKWLGLNFGEWITLIPIVLMLLGFFVGVVMALFV